MIAITHFLIFLRNSKIECNLHNCEADFISFPERINSCPALDQAFALKQRVLVDAKVEYRGLTRHAWGTSRALAKRTPPSVLLRLAGRALWRAIFNSP